MSELLDLELDLLEAAIKHGKHDQSSHGRRTARRRAYSAAYSSARAGGASPADARAAAREAGIARQGERDARLERLREAAERRANAPATPEATPQLNARQKRDQRIRELEAESNRLDREARMEKDRTKQMELEKRAEKVGNERFNLSMRNYEIDELLAQATGPYRRRLTEINPETHRRRLAELEKELADGLSTSLPPALRLSKRRQQQIRNSINSEKNWLSVLANPEYIPEFSRQKRVAEERIAALEAEALTL